MADYEYTFLEPFRRAAIVQARIEAAEYEHFDAVLAELVSKDTAPREAIEARLDELKAKKVEVDVTVDVVAAAETSNAEARSAAVKPTADALIVAEQALADAIASGDTDDIAAAIAAHDTAKQAYNDALVLAQEAFG